MIFQEKLQLLRKRRNFSQEDLAEKIGISRQAVAKWESGQATPDVDNLILLSDLFKVSIDRLVKAEEDCSVCFDQAGQADSMEFTDFLCKAKKATYAGHGCEADSSRPKSHDLQYVDGDYQYIDTYLGGERFAGEEAVWFKGLPVWSMNYCGRVLDDGFSGNFLKEVLSLVPAEYPFRGPMLHRDGDYTYHCTFSGNIEWFQGFEDIFLSDQKVYECFFHGGTVK